jgi:hypothetical protein
MPERALVTLVHGTWGRGIFKKANDTTGLWFDQQSDFVVSLRSTFARYHLAPEFLEFSWSGSNSITARSDAARGLVAHLTTAFDNEPLCPHLVIAHSHGGNVALLASKAYENSRLHIVTLATPLSRFTRVRY